MCVNTYPQTNVDKSVKISLIRQIRQIRVPIFSANAPYLDIYKKVNKKNYLNYF